jgi:hypothetical protein
MQLPVDRARSLLEMGYRTQNEALVDEARALFESIGAGVDLAFSLHVLARMAAAGNNSPSALQRYDRAVSALDAAGCEYAFATASRERALLLAACGRLGDAKADIARSRRGFATLGADTESSQAEELERTMG